MDQDISGLYTGKSLYSSIASVTDFLPKIFFQRLIMGILFTATDAWLSTFTLVFRLGITNLKDGWI